MGKYLAILDALGAKSNCDKSDKSDKNPPFGRFCRFGRTSPSPGRATAARQAPQPGSPALVFAVLEARCPQHVDIPRWQQAVEDGKRFLAAWASQAEALGWTARDLFGLHTPPANPHLSYSRLARYDETGLIWLLQGRPVVALTEATAAIQSSTGAITIYRRHNEPALGPPGDSLDDLA